ncbi:MAG: hypothetical protein AAB484_02615 [Patescibacteria group bacterium]
MNIELNLGCFAGTLATPVYQVLEINRSTPLQINWDGEWDRWEVYEEDEVSTKISVVDLSKIHLAKTNHPTVLERIEYFKTSPFIRADAKIFETLWNRRFDLLNGWVRADGNNCHISFEGTLFKSCRSFGVIEMIHNGIEWKWHIHRLTDDGSASSASVVIER